MEKLSALKDSSPLNRKYFERLVLREPEGSTEGEVPVMTFVSLIFCLDQAKQK